MKKFLFSILAIIFAFGFNSFSKTSKRDGDIYIFKFVGNASFQNQVQDECNWYFDRVEDASEPQTTCTQNDEQACEIGILVEMLVVNPSSLEVGDELCIVAPSVEIAATLGSSWCFKYIVDILNSINIAVVLNTSC